MSTTTRRVYVVICGDWTYNDEFYEGDNRPIKAFSDRDQAEAYVRRCEYDAHTQRQLQQDLDYHIVEMEMPV